MTRRELKAKCTELHCRCYECPYNDYTGCVVKRGRKYLVPSEYPDDILDQEVKLKSNSFFYAYMYVMLLIVAVAAGAVLGNWLWEVIAP